MPNCPHEWFYLAAEFNSFAKKEMIQIGNTIVSFDLLDKYFVCNLKACKGACCVQGDSGAPLEPDEAEQLENVFAKAKKYMQAAGIASIEANGPAVIDSDGDLVTPLIEGKECAYTFFENGTAFCAIEKAYFNDKTNFRKPVSCHLYPVRITLYKSFEAVNYHHWDICACALKEGENAKIPLYIYLKEPLIRRYGKDWFAELETAAKFYSDLNK